MARATKLLAAIEASAAPASVLAARFGTTGQGVRKCKHRSPVDDRSHTPHRLQSETDQETVRGTVSPANGMLKRCNGRIEAVLQSHHFRSGEKLETTLHRYVALYNQQLPQSALGSKTPLQAMKDWHRLKPELFRKQPYFLAGCDTYHRQHDHGPPNLASAAPPR